MMEKLVVVLVVVEAIVLAVLLTSMHAAAAGRWRGKWLGDGRAVCGLVDDGSLAPWFWALVVACGLAMAAFGGSDRLDFASGETPAKAVGQAGERSDRGLEAPTGLAGKGSRIPAIL